MFVLRHDVDGSAAFEREVLPHADRLFRFAMWVERNRADAEDIVQDTMVQARRSFHRFHRGTNCRAWLIASLLRKASQQRRSPIHRNLTDEHILEGLRRLRRAMRKSL
jgi:DNA-directed RNA polymerase specialized sigma24 family protein